MPKIISAQSILKQKGYVQPKFDTSGFMNAVADFFLKNSVDSKLLLIPFRFLDIDRSRRPDGKIKNNPFHITPDEETAGYKVETAMSEEEPTWPDWAIKLNESDWELAREQLHAGLVSPRIIIDKPFFENAAATLRLMGGYIVEKQTKKRRKLYWVTLV